MHQARLSPYPYSYRFQLEHDIPVHLPHQVLLRAFPCSRCVNIWHRSYSRQRLLGLVPGHKAFFPACRSTHCLVLLRRHYALSLFLANRQRASLLTHPPKSHARLGEHRFRSRFCCQRALSLHERVTLYVRLLDYWHV